MRPVNEVLQQAFALLAAILSTRKSVTKLRRTVLRTLQPSAKQSRMRNSFSSGRFRALHGFTDRGENVRRQWRHLKRLVISGYFLNEDDAGKRPRSRSQISTRLPYGFRDWTGATARHGFQMGDGAHGGFQVSVAGFYESPAGHGELLSSRAGLRFTSRQRF